MSQQRRLIASAVAVIAAIAAGWVLLVAPKREQISAVQEQVAQAESRRDGALATLAAAERARAEYRRDAGAFTGVVKAVPTDDDVGPLIKQLDAIARANKIDFRSAKLGAAPAAPAAPVAPPPPEGEGDGDDEAAADETAPPTDPVAQSPPGATVGPAALLTLPFSFTFDGGYGELQRFLRAVHGLAKSEGGRLRIKGRLMTIDGFSLAAGRNGFPNLTALVSATAYVMPDVAATPSPAATAPAAAPDPAGAGG